MFSYFIILYMILRYFFIRHKNNFKFKSTLDIEFVEEFNRTQMDICHLKRHH